MDFYTYTTTRDACHKAGVADAPDAFYETALADVFAGRLQQSLWSHIPTPWRQCWAKSRLTRTPLVVAC